MHNKLSYIKKLKGGKWRVYSKGGRNLGTYTSEKAAKKRLQQIHYFKNNIEDDFENDARDITDYFDITKEDMPDNLKLNVVESNNRARFGKLWLLNKEAKSNS